MKENYTDGASMYKYEKPNYVAIEMFRDRFLILYIANLIFMFFLTYFLKMKQIESAKIFFSVALITLIFEFIFWYRHVLKFAKSFFISFSNESINICDKEISFFDIQKIFLTKKSDLIIISKDNMKLKIYNSIENFGEILERLQQVTKVENKAEIKDNIMYAANLFLFIDPTPKRSTTRKSRFQPKKKARLK